MNTPRMLLLLALAGLVTLPACTQVMLPAGPEALPELSAVTFGWASMSGLDPNIDAFSTFAPPIVAVKETGYDVAIEAAQGQFTFSGFHVNSNFESAITKLGPGMLRVSHYGFKSNNAPIVAIGPNANVTTRGDAIELSYAQRIKDTTIGVSYVPQDDATIRLTTVDMAPLPDGSPLVTGTVKARNGLRGGFIQHLPDNFQVGVEYSYQRAHSEGGVLIEPLLPMLPVSGDYLVRVGTVGAAWKPYQNTQVYFAYQDILAKGDGLDRHAVLQWGGVRQHLTRDLMVSANYLDGGQNYLVSWRTKFGALTAAYTHGALKNAEDVLGKGDAFFYGAAWAF